jgi:hypothetical protein
LVVGSALPNDCTPSLVSIIATERQANCGLTCGFVNEKRDLVRLNASSH